MDGDSPEAQADELAVADDAVLLVGEGGEGEIRWAIESMYVMD